MTIKYYNPGVLIDTCCEHCGEQQKLTLELLYSEEKLVCVRCGLEHTSDREEFRRNIDETEAFISKIPDWP